MRVLHLIESLTPSGAEQSLAAMLPALRQLGVDSEVGYLFERPGLGEELRHQGFTLHSLHQVPRRRLAYVRAIGELIRSRRPDLVHTTLFETDVAGRVAASWHGIPVVSTLANVAYGPEQLRSHGIKSTRIKGAQAVDAGTATLVKRFHAVTPYVASTMSRRLLVPRRRIEVIPRGRDRLAIGSPGVHRRLEVRERLGLSPATPLVLAAARMEIQKGLDILLEALPEAIRQVPDLQVAIAGREGAHTPALRRLAEGPTIREHVKFLGMRQDVPDLMVAADAFAFPSRWEGAGGALIEAMALGCPIVTSDLETLSYLVDGSVARLFPAGDSDRLAAGIVEALTDRTGAEERATRALGRFEAGFTIDSVAKKMTDLYESVTRH